MKPDSRFPRLRAAVRPFTSPRRVGFWAVTLPVLLAPVALFLVMRPGVKFEHRVQVGAAEAIVDRRDDEFLGRVAKVAIEWPGGEGRAVCWVRPAELVFDSDPARHHFGPLDWEWDSHTKLLGLDSGRFYLGVCLNH